MMADLFCRWLRRLLCRPPNRKAGPGMQAIIGEVNRALEAELYYLAVMLSLSLPDICAALEAPTGETTRPQYMAWCDQWFTGYPDLTSKDLYCLRCGVLHQGRLGHKGMQYARVLFTLPDIVRGNYAHGNVMNDALNLDAITFCRDMVGCVMDWYAAKKGDANVVKNLSRLVQLHENGLSPYITGVPVIA